MKNLYKRAAALALAATMTAGVLAGCNGSNTTASTGGGEVSTPASGDAADPASQPFLGAAGNHPADLVHVH